MRTLTLTGEKTALLIGATGIRSIEQNIRMILTTFMYCLLYTSDAADEL